MDAAAASDAASRGVVAFDLDEGVEGAAAAAAGSGAAFAEAFNRDAAFAALISSFLKCT